MDLTHLKELELAIATGRATDAELAKVPLADVVAIKRSVPFQVRARGCDHLDASAMTVLPEDLVFERAADGAGDQTRRRTYVASSEHVDRMGDIIRVYGAPKREGKGWQLGAIKEEPVFLWSHDSGSPPIGTLAKVWRERAYGHKDGAAPALLATVDYLAEDLNPVAEVVWKMVKANVLRTVSVGFLPQKDSYGQLGEGEAEAMGLGRWGVEFTQQELLELSQAVVPANPFALVTSIKAMVETGAVTDREARAFAKVYPMTQADVVERLSARVRSFVDLGATTPVPAPGAGLDAIAAAAKGLVLTASAPTPVPVPEVVVAPPTATAYGDGMDPQGIRLTYGEGDLAGGFDVPADELTTAEGGSLVHVLTADSALDLARHIAEAHGHQVLPAGERAAPEALADAPEAVRAYMAAQIERAYAGMEGVGEQLSVLLDALQGKAALAAAAAAGTQVPAPAAPTPAVEAAADPMAQLTEQLAALVGVLAKENTPQGGPGGAAAPHAQGAQPEGAQGGDTGGTHKAAPDPTDTLLAGAGDLMARLGQDVDHTAGSATP